MRFYRSFSQDPLGFVGGRFEKYGDIYFTISNSDPLFVTRHPEHAHELLVKKAAAFAKRSEDLRPVLGDGLLTANGRLWRRQRRRIQPAFSHQRLQVYASSMVEATDRMLDTWEKGQSQDIVQTMMRLTLGIVCKTLFDHDISEDAGRVAEAMTVLQDSAAQADLLPRWLPTPLHQRQQRAIDRLDSIIYELIEARRKAPAQDLSSQLVHPAPGEESMSATQIRDELVTMFLAGHETTSLALTWALYLLAQHPEVEAKLHAELDSVLGGRAPTMEDLPKLPWTQCVIKESMRLYPPAYVVPRIALESVQIGGYDLRPGSEIILWVYFMHRDERWFEAPQSFLPERFEPGSALLRNPSAYLPFGAGSRACIGQHFAMMEAQLVLAAVARRFALRLEPGQTIVPRPRITLTAGSPILMRASKRT